MDAKQEQRRLGGNRADRVAGETAWRTIVCDGGNDGDPRGKGAEDGSKELTVDGQVATLRARGGPGTLGTQIGARHCIPGAQSAGPWQGKEHFCAATLHLCVRHCASDVQGTPCGLGFMPPAAGAAGAAGPERREQAPPGAGATGAGWPGTG